MMLTGQILLQLIVILLVVQAFGYLCSFIGQPRVIGEILAGLALGPTLLGAILPRVEATVFPSSVLPTLQTLGDIGLVLYMFSLGTQIDTHTMLRQSRKATVVSLSGIPVSRVCRIEGQSRIIHATGWYGDGHHGISGACTPSC
jgi:Kef-type K+ transport system membrane component KefB